MCKRITELADRGAPRTTAAQSMALGEREMLYHHQIQSTGPNATSNGSHSVQNTRSSKNGNVGVMGSRRIFAPSFKLKVLDSYRNDIDCRGNQRATARKYGIHRRQIQKWLQCEDNLRSCCAESTNNGNIPQRGVSTSPSSSTASSPPLQAVPPPHYPPTPAAPYYYPAAQPHPMAPVYPLPVAHLVSQTPVKIEPSVPFSSGSDYSDKDTSSDSEVDLGCGQGQGAGRRRSFSLRFKLNVLDAFHRDVAVAGNQRATARKYGINRRQVQKWLGQEGELRGVQNDARQRLTTTNSCPLACCNNNNNNNDNNLRKRSLESPPSCCDSSENLAKRPRIEESEPLCLVKPKVSPVAPSANRDAILFKPYLDNPVCRPADDHGTRAASSPLGSSACGLNLEMSFNKQPTSWKLPTTCFAEIQSPLKSAFVRYTAGARYA